MQTGFDVRGIPRAAWGALQRFASNVQSVVDALNTPEQGMDADVEDLSGIEAASDKIRQLSKVADITRNFDRKFTLFHMDGDFNADNKGNRDGIYAHSPPITDSTFVFSREYLQSLRRDDYFVRVAYDFYISTAAIIDLCRSPAFFALSHESGTNLLKAICRQHATKDTRGESFSSWVDSVGNLLEEDANLMANQTMLFDLLSMVRRGVCILRSTFLLSRLVKDEARVRDLKDYLSMEYDVWIREILKNHWKTEKGADQTADDIDDVVTGMMHVDPVIEMMVRSVDKVREEEAVSEHRALAPIKMDLFYANLVHGAAVRIPFTEIWCANNEVEHSEADSERFFKVMWGSLEEVIRSSLAGRVSILTTAQQQQQQGRAGAGLNSSVSINAADFMDGLAKSVKRIKDTKRIMKEIWEASKDYRISDRVHMVEVQVLQRLKADGVFPYVDVPSSSSRGSLRFRHGAPSSGGSDTEMALQNIHVCFYMRRKEQLRYAFASAVGKRLYTQRMGSTAAKSSIIDHHRSVNWSETEYINLLGVVRANADMIGSDLGEGGGMVRISSDNEHLFKDYCRMMVPSASVDLKDLQRKGRWAM